MSTWMGLSVTAARTNIHQLTGTRVDRTGDAGQRLGWDAVGCVYAETLNGGCLDPHATSLIHIERSDGTFRRSQSQVEDLELLASVS